MARGRRPDRQPPRPGAVYPRAEELLRADLLLLDNNATILRAVIEARQANLDDIVRDVDNLRIELEALERIT